MTTFPAALVRERGVRFVVVPVRDSVICSPIEAGEVMHRMQSLFQCPPVLLGSHSREILGRHDLVRFVRSVGIERLPWRKWTVN